MSGPVAEAIYPGDFLFLLYFSTYESGLPFAIVCSRGNWHNSKQGNQFETLNAIVI